MLDSLWQGVANLLDKALGESRIDTLLEFLMFKSSNTNYDYDPFWNVVNSVLGHIKPFGFALIVTFFLMYMFDAATKEQITMDSIIKVLIQLVLAVALIGNIETIINTFLGISEYLVELMLGNNNASSTAISGADIVDKWKENDPYGFIGAFADALVVWLCSVITRIAINFAAISRIIELGWRICLAPVACANVFEGGTNSPGVKYLKSLFAIILSSVALLVVAELGMSISATFLSSGSIDIDMITANDLNNSLMGAAAAQLATAGAAVGISNKIKEVVS